MILSNQAWCKPKLVHFTYCNFPHTLTVYIVRNLEKLYVFLDETSSCFRTVRKYKASHSGDLDRSTFMNIKHDVTDDSWFHWSCCVGFRLPFRLVDSMLTTKEPQSLPTRRAFRFHFFQIGIRVSPISSLVASSLFDFCVPISGVISKDVHCLRVPGELLSSTFISTSLALRTNTFHGK